MRTTNIKLTSINIDYTGQLLDMYLDRTCLLRTARKVGDIETVNNYVLGILKEQKERGCIDFIKIQ